MATEHISYENALQRLHEMTGRRVWVSVNSTAERRGGGLINVKGPLQYGRPRSHLADAVLDFPRSPHEIIDFVADAAPDFLRSPHEIIDPGFPRSPHEIIDFVVSDVPSLPKEGPARQRQHPKEGSSGPPRHPTEVTFSVVDDAFKSAIWDEDLGMLTMVLDDLELSVRDHERSMEALGLDPDLI